MGVADHEFEARIAEYKQIGDLFRALTEIRFKLLGFLPLGTALVALNRSDGRMNSLIAAFGLVVVAGLATYDQRNDQLYDELVSRAAELERELKLERGSFNQRPMPWLRIAGWTVSHRPSVRLVYVASAGLWAYLLADGLVPHPAGDSGNAWLRRVEEIAPYAAALTPLAAWRILRSLTESARTALRTHVGVLRSVLEDSANDVAVITAKVLEGGGLEAALGSHPEAKVKRRLEYNMGLLDEGRRERDQKKLALVLSRAIDLPARWIEDVWTGRR